MAIIEKVQERGINESGTSKYLPVIEVTKLPSGFKPYPNGIKVFYKPYTFGEIKKLSQDELSMAKKYEYALSGVTVEGMDKYNLTVSDILYILLLRKLSIPGIDSVSVTKRCSHCDELILNKRVPLSEVEFDELKYEMPLSTEIEGKVYSFSPMTIGNMLELAKETDSPSEEQLLAYTCVSPGPKEALEMIKYVQDNMMYIDETIHVLNAIDERMFHGVLPITVKCDNKDCEFENKVSLDGEEQGTLVLPFREQPVSIESRISSGK